MSNPERRFLTGRQHVYFIQSGGEGGPIKIGVTTDPQLRLKRLQTGSAAPLRLLGTVKGDVNMERAYHAHFAKHRIRSEWFAAAPEIMAAIPPKIDGFQGDVLAAVIASKSLEVKLREHRI